jgi:hypothetical protein
MTYNPPSGNITSMVDFFDWINSTISNWFFPGIVIAAFFVILVRMMYNTNNIGQAFAASSFICMILSVLLRVADLVSNAFMIIFIILTAIGAVWMHTENAKFN